MNPAQQWRTYNKRVPGGLALLCSLSGSGCPRALPFGVVAGVSCAMLELYADIDGFNLFEHTYPFHVIAFITGFGLIFRLNIAYQRYWEDQHGRNAPQHTHAAAHRSKGPPACSGLPSGPKRRVSAEERLQRAECPRCWPKVASTASVAMQEARSLTQSMAAKWCAAGAH